MIKWLLCMALVLSSCSSTSKNNRYNALAAQMTKAEVQSSLGEPQEKSLIDGIETWYYENRTFLIRFKDQKVTAFGRSQDFFLETGNSTSPQPATPPPEGSRALGERCESNSNCQSGNCHFKTCAGKNNCTLTFGKTCATDSQCCEGKCDFGKCKIRP
ncbi:MAG: hypothetical protein IT289_06740 [Oligoflexia bacterium]|nr:hypothetical protein [Oligoflexia bacterium]